MEFSEPGRPAAGQYGQNNLVPVTGRARWVAASAAGPAPSASPPSHTRTRCFASDRSRASVTRAGRHSLNPRISAAAGVVRCDHARSTGQRQAANRIGCRHQFAGVDRTGLCRSDGAGIAIQGGECGGIAVVSGGFRARDTLVGDMVCLPGDVGQPQCRPFVATKPAAATGPGNKYRLRADFGVEYACAQRGIV